MTARGWTGARSSSPKRRRAGCLATAGTGVLILAWLIDAAIHLSFSEQPWFGMIANTLGLWALRQAKEPISTVRVTVAALSSAAVTYAVLLDAARVGVAPGEGLILLVLSVVAGRRGLPHWRTGLRTLCATAVVILPLRLAQADDSDPGGTVLGMMLLVGLLVAATTAVDARLRYTARRRLATIGNARRAERLRIAADLHDHIAHHVTGILVQTQMARMLSASDPGRVDGVLAGVEQAATEALEAMRHTVGILNSGPDSPGADRSPGGDLSTLPELVAGFQLAGGTPATLRADVADPGSVPAETQIAACRVVQEALTNVRRHAADATEVIVDLTRQHETLRIKVADNGRGTGSRLPHRARGGGFGLVGLTERVTALGGDLHAGRRPEGGWQIIAHLPVPAERSASRPS